MTVQDPSHQVSAECHQEICTEHHWQISSFTPLFILILTHLYRQRSNKWWTTGNDWLFRWRTTCCKPTNNLSLTFLIVIMVLSIIAYSTQIQESRRWRHRGYNRTTFAIM